jgi:preprotein translocase subunit YajC
MGQAPAAAMNGQPSPLMGMMPFVLIFVIFYFLLIKPQQKKQKEHEEMLKKLKKNDEVVTGGGIHGTIVNVKDDTVVLRVDDNCKLEVQKSSVALLKKSRPEG